MGAIQILSIGYERRSVSEFLGLLQSYGIRKLFDVRELPLSRRSDFSKNKLSLSLLEAGIEYQHLHFAGNPYRKESTNIFDCLGRYALYLHEHPGIIERVAGALTTTPVAMLCYERQHTSCHRSVLLRELQQFGYSIDIVRAEGYGIDLATQTYFDVGQNSP